MFKSVSLGLLDIKDNHNIVMENMKISEWTMKEDTILFVLKRNTNFICQYPIFSIFH